MPCPQQQGTRTCQLRAAAQVEVSRAPQLGWQVPCLQQQGWHLQPSKQLRQAVSYACKGKQYITNSGNLSQGGGWADVMSWGKPCRGLAARASAEGLVCVRLDMRQGGVLPGRPGAADRAAPSTKQTQATGVLHVPPRPSQLVPCARWVCAHIKPVEEEQRKNRPLALAWSDAQHSVHLATAQAAATAAEALDACS